MSHEKAPARRVADPFSPALTKLGLQKGPWKATQPTRGTPDPGMPLGPELCKRSSTCERGDLSKWR